MAKLPRTTQKIFAKNAAAGQVTTFGSIKDGTPVYSTSAGDIMNSNFEDGWSAAVEDDYAPYRQDRNGVDTAVTQQLAYLFQEGIPEYDSGTVYYKGSICKVTDGTGVKIYKSIYDNHSAAVTNTSRWHLILNVDSTNTIVSPSISNPTISGGSMSNGTFANPTFSGTVNVPLASASGSTDSTIAASIGWVNNASLSSNVVHKTNDETIAGGKTFTGNTKFQGSAITQWAIVKTDITKGTNPSETKECRMMVFDSNGTSTYKNLVGGVDIAQTTSGTVATYLRAYKPVAGSGDYESIAVYYPASGSAYTSAPTPSANDSSTKIATTQWANTTGNNIVHRTDSETIGGDKTFTNTIQVEGNIGNKNANVTKGTNPETNQYWSNYFVDKNGTASANSLGAVITTLGTDGLVQTSMYAYKNASGTTSAKIGVYYPATGDPYTYAPTPATSDNSAKIATTAFVKAQGYASDSDVVKTSGDQTITGVKTFSSTISGSIDGNAATVTNGVYTTGNQNVGGTKTFTSDVTISKSNPTLISKNTAITKGTVPTSGGTPTNNNTYACVYRDSANKNIGAIMYQYNTSKDVQTRLYAYKANASGDNADAYLRVYYNADGKFGLALGTDNSSSDTNESVVNSTTSTSNTTIPCMGWVNAVLKTSGRGLFTFSNAQNGYYKFTSGLIIQWGYINSSASSITYSQPFSSATSYSITTTAIRSSGGTNWRGQVNTRTTTNCNIVTDSASEWLWIAIGY